MPVFAAELNLSAAFTALAIGGVLLAIVWVLDRRALHRELEVDEEYEAVGLLHEELMQEAIVHDDQVLDAREPSVRVIGPMRQPRIDAPVATAEQPAVAVIEPEPVIELEPEPIVEVEPEIVLEPVAAAPAKRSLPKGAEAVLAALTEVIPDPRNTTLTIKDPTAEVSVHRVDRSTAQELREFFETPVEPSGAELVSRQRANQSSPSTR